MPTMTPPPTKPAHSPAADGLWTQGWYRFARHAPSPNFGLRPPQAVVDLVVAVVAAADADAALQRWLALPAGSGARLIGEVHDGPARVVLHTELGGQRILEELEDDPLPRIC